MSRQHDAALRPAVAPFICLEPGELQHAERKGMQRLICAAVFFASAARPVTAGDEDIRFWSDNTGTFTLRAELLQVDELGGSVLLEAPDGERHRVCLLYTSPSPRDQRGSRMPSSA